jgi:hypothetical protein
MAKAPAKIPSEMLVLRLRPRLSEMRETVTKGMAETIMTAKAHAIERHITPKSLRNTFVSRFAFL